MPSLPASGRYVASDHRTAKDLQAHRWATGMGHQHIDFDIVGSLEPGPTLPTDTVEVQTGDPSFHSEQLLSGRAHHVSVTIAIAIDGYES